MTKYLLPLYAILFSWVPPSLLAQSGPMENPHIDSLIKVNEPLYRRFPEKTKKEALRIYDLSKQEGYTRGQGIALSQYGNALYVQGAYDSALWYHNRGIGFRQQAGDREGEGLGYQNIGNTWFDRGNHDKALENYLKAESIFREVGSMLYVGNIYNNIGMVYSGLQRSDDAIEILLKAVKIYEDLQREDKLATTYNNLNGIYMESEDYEKAEVYAQLSLDISRRTQDTKSIANGLANLGYLLFYQNRFEESEQQFIEALEKYRDLGNTFGELHALHGRGLALDGKGETEEGIALMLESIDLVKKLKAEQHFFEFYKELAEMYSKLDQPSEALNTYRTYSLLSDSLRSAEYQEQLAEMSERFNSERKDLQIREGNLLVEKKETQVIALASGAALLLLLLFFVVRGYLQKQRSNRLLSQQKSIIEQKNQQITESISYAQRIQEAMLPPRELLQQLLPGSEVIYQPRDGVSGDFYWVADTPEGILLAVADCTGHGVPGAFMSMMGHTLLHEIVGEKGIYQPGRILTLMNAAVETALRQEGNADQEDGMDISLLLLDRKKGSFRFAGANSRMWRLREGAVERLEGGLFSVGGMAVPGVEKEFPEIEMDWQAGDKVVLSTDGFWDQFGGPGNKKIGLKQMESLLLAPVKPSEELASFFEQWKGDGKQTDDVLVVVI